MQIVEALQREGALHLVGTQRRAHEDAARDAWQEIDVVVAPSAVVVVDAQAECAHELVGADGDGATAVGRRHLCLYVGFLQPQVFLHTEESVGLVASSS